MAGPAAVPGVDPSGVNTPDELAACLDGLRRRRGLSYEAMEKAAAKLPSRSGGSRLEPLPKSTVGEIVTAKRLPTKGKLLTFLAVCEVAPADRAQWLAAWERASTADLARPAGAVRVRDAGQRLLGVHAAISVPGVPDDVPPQYVLRDVDNAEFGVRARVKAAAQGGGFVLLVGGSSVGKTRCAFEAAKTLLPDWWIVHPAGPAEVAALEAAPTPRTVVWLDELQRYFDGEHRLTGGLVRTLLNAPNPAVIIGTLWPDRYAAYTAVPALGSADPHAREREVLDLAAVIRIDPEFSPAEQDRDRAAAARDPRVAIALGASGYGLTQTLAAAPQLLQLCGGERGRHGDVMPGQQLPHLGMGVGAARRAGGQAIPELRPQRGQHQHRGPGRVPQPVPQSGRDLYAQPAVRHVEVELGLVQPHHRPRPDARQLTQRGLRAGRVDRMPQPPLVGRSRSSRRASQQARVLPVEDPPTSTAIPLRPSAAARITEPSFVSWSRGTWGAGNNRAVSAATASSFLNAGTAGGWSAWPERVVGVGGPLLRLAALVSLGLPGIPARSSCRVDEAGNPLREQKARNSRSGSASRLRRSARRPGSTAAVSRSWTRRARASSSTSAAMHGR